MLGKHYLIMYIDIDECTTHWMLSIITSFLSFQYRDQKVEQEVGLQENNSYCSHI